MIRQRNIEGENLVNWSMTKSPVTGKTEDTNQQETYVLIWIKR
jgi:hypothetical protein